MEEQTAQSLNEVHRRLDSLERAASSIPAPRGSAPPAEPHGPARGASRFFDEKVVITGLVSLFGIWATYYSNDAQMEQQRMRSEKEFELEAVKYQLGEYLAAKSAEERVTVLQVIRETPHTSPKMKRWAESQYDKQLAELETRTRKVASAEEANRLKAVKAEQDPDEAANIALSASEQEQAREAGDRAVQQLEEQIQQGRPVAPSSHVPSARDRARSLWSEGFQAYQRKDYLRAEELYRASHAADDDYAPPLNSLGRILYDRREFKAAESSFRESLRRDPSYAPAAYNLVLALVRAQRMPEAKRALAEAVRVAPNYSKRATVEARLRNPKEVAVVNDVVQPLL